MPRRDMIYVVVSGGLITVMLLLTLLGGAHTTLAEPAAEPTSTVPPPVLTRQPDTASANNPNEPMQTPIRHSPNDVDAPQAGTSYLHVSGSVFVPLYSGTTFAYGGSGCVYLSGGGNLFLQFPLQLPDQSTVTQLRLYFKDTNASFNGTLWLAQYDDGLDYTYIVTATTSGNSDWGTTTVNFNKMPDYVNYSYTLLWAAPVAGSTLELCGFRVAYTPPIFGVALPLIKK